MSHLETPPSISATDAPDIWRICLDKLTASVPDNQITTWLKPLELELNPECTVATLWIANRFKLDWIRSQYLKAISHTIAQVISSPVDIVLALRTQSAPAREKVPTNLANLMGDPLYAPPELIATSADSTTLQTKLNSTLTFDNLIEGSANRMARAASLHVANIPGTLYNPLFIYGGVGLGKTHLMHAIGNQLLNQKPLAKVLYIHAEQFVSDVVRAYQRKTFDEFKNRYHNLDLLLIDDVQFFANKERTQEEFFNAFEALLARKSHIVMTSDTYPKGLTNIHERLVSRFDAGLTVALEPPELELRVAILMNKTQAEGLVMPEDVAFFVAKNVRSNVRELEGALRKILAFSKFNQKEISIA
ncbi:MAG: hypothetical protein RLY82_1661, partial [Pseudomonadota bacterium]